MSLYSNVGWDISVGIATAWTVRGSNPGGGEFSAPAQAGSGTHPASCTIGTDSVPGGKATPSSAEFKEREEL